MKKFVSIVLFAISALLLSSTVFAGISPKAADTSSSPVFLNQDEAPDALVLSDRPDKDDDDDDDDDKEKPE